MKHKVYAMDLIKKNLDKITNSIQWKKLRNFWCFNIKSLRYTIGPQLLLEILQLIIYRFQSE